VVRSVVHHQNYSFRRVSLHQQFFQKDDECGTVLRQGDRPSDRVTEPVIATKNRPFLFFTCGLVAGIRFCCPIFIQQALRGGSLCVCPGLQSGKTRWRASNSGSPGPSGSDTLPRCTTERQAAIITWKPLKAVSPLHGCTLAGSSSQLAISWI